jgi:glycogen debranching enzyme
MAAPLLVGAGLFLSPTARIASAWSAGTILFFFAENNTSEQNAAFHARIAGTVLDLTACSPHLMRATPTTHHNTSFIPI